MFITYWNIMFFSVGVGSLLDHDLQPLFLHQGLLTSDVSSSSSSSSLSNYHKLSELFTSLVPFSIMIFINLVWE